MSEVPSVLAPTRSGPKSVSPGWWEQDESGYSGLEG